MPFSSGGYLELLHWRVKDAPVDRSGLVRLRDRRSGARRPAERRCREPAQRAPVPWSARLEAQHGAGPALDLAFVTPRGCSPGRSGTQLCRPLRFRWWPRFAVSTCSYWPDDQPGAASIGHPLPGPLKEYGNSTPETDQEENMGKCPHQPADKTGNLDEAEIHDRLRTTNDRQRTRIAVAECRRRSFTFELTADHACDVGTLLLRDRRQQRQRLSSLVTHRGHVANREDVRRSGQ